jgi:hypothetical protein
MVPAESRCARYDQSIKDVGQQTMRASKQHLVAARVKFWRATTQPLGMGQHLIGMGQHLTARPSSDELPAKRYADSLSIFDVMLFEDFGQRRQLNTSSAHGPVRASVWATLFAFSAVSRAKPIQTEFGQFRG